MSVLKVWWWRYSGSGLWHARLVGEERSLCGQVESWLPGLPRPQGRACRTCHASLDRLRRGDPCQAPAPCGCDGCREWRADHAEAFARSFRTGVCRCVAEWPGARDYVAALEARLGGQLLSWELTGEPAAAREVEVVERTLRQAWRVAEGQYELLDGSHPHRERQL